MIRLLFLIACSLFTHACAEEDAPLYIQLETEAQLLPLYVTPIVNSSSGFSPEYLQQLEKVLKFDLSHNAMTDVVARTPQRERLSQALTFDAPADLSPWMNENLYFVVQARVKEKKLGARLYIINSNQIKTIDGLELTGNLSSDRRIIHNLSDMIHKSLFQKNGIASTKVLYTVKQYKSGTKKAVSEVFEADYDGGNPRQVTKTGFYNVTPSYIPPRPGYQTRHFIFVSYEIGQPKIYLGNLETGETQRLSLLKGNQLMPALSPQRSMLAFISDVTGNPDLFIQEFDPEKGLIDKPRQLYATHKATQSTPTFSPDGKKVAFVSNKDGSPRIYLITIPPAGTPLKEIKAQLISKSNRENSAPCWSPDGSKITYCSMTKGVRQIWLYDVLTGRERQLTKGPGNKENPSFAPNSLHIIFNSTDKDESELYIVNLNQPDATKISSGSGEKHFPSWEPRLSKE
jgi:TolB protein